MKRFGTVLVFKRGVTKREAEEALEKIRDVLTEDYWIDQGNPKLENGMYNHVPFNVHEFDDEMDGPVWYLP